MRIFKKETEDGSVLFFDIEDEKISKKYNAYGWYKKNESYNPEEHDEDDEDTWEFIPYREDDYIDDPDVFNEQGEPDVLEHEYEYYGYFDGSNWKEVILKNEYSFCEYTEVTDEFEDGYFGGLVLACSSPDKQGTNKEFYYEPNEKAFFIKHKSRWQGTWVEPYEPVEESEWLYGALPYWVPSEGEKELIPMIKGVSNPVGVVDDNYSIDYVPWASSSFEVVDLDKAECIDAADSSQSSGVDVYELEDGRRFKRHWSRFQGDVDRFYWA